MTIDTKQLDPLTERLQEVRDFYRDPVKYAPPPAPQWGTTLRMVSLAIAVAWLAWLMGCVENRPAIKQAGNKNDADTALVMAKMDKVADRIVGVNKEIQTSVKGDIKATRDAVQTTNQNTGTGEWAMVIIFAIVAFERCFCRHCEKQENVAESTTRPT